MDVRAALIVEDDDAVQYLLRRALQKHCNLVDTASDGEQAVEMLRQKTYDLVMLDLMLPKVDGFSVAEKIGSLPAPPQVIVLSAIARYDTARLPAGTIVLQKPFDVSRLDDVISKLPR